MLISDKIRALADEADAALAGVFTKIEQNERVNTERVLDAFREFRLTEAHFYPSTGYGYGDIGREAIDKIYARVFGKPAALVRHHFISGTHALAVGLNALLRPGDVMLSVTGAPYDTLAEVIGADEKYRGDNNGSLTDYGVEYRRLEFRDGRIDLAAVREALTDKKIKVVYLQRSKGYQNRPTLSADEISDFTAFSHSLSDAYVVVDNCYGEFTETREPDADMLIGSLIKNPGGGIANCGGYIAGTERAVELASYRLSSVGIGGEAGATLGQNRNILRGFFEAPTVVAAALKTAAFAAYVFGKLGFEVAPSPFESRSDIIQTVITGSPDALIAFCEGIQYGSPVDAFVKPEPWAMPGYADEVIMAAGTFVAGASIELSADGPMRAPYTAFMQGGLTYPSGRLGVMSAAEYVSSRVSIKIT